MDLQNRTQAVQGSSRNVSIELFRFLASLFVITAHVTFPGKYGWIFPCIAHSAVPGFFAIAGYFSYGSSSRKLASRSRHLLKVLLWGVGLMLAWNCIAVEMRVPAMARYDGSVLVFLKDSILTGKMLAELFLLCLVPGNYAMWYMMAALECYGIFWLYTRFFGEETPNYKPLYNAGAMLLAIFLLRSTYASAVGAPVYSIANRGALLMGIPMFSIGLFIREYSDRIWKNYGLTGKKLAVLALAGGVLSLLEKVIIAENEMYLGSVVMIAALVLLMDRYPNPFSRTTSLWVQRGGRWSVGIYLVHPVAISIFEYCFRDQLEPVWPNWRWFRLMVIFVVSIAAAAMNEWLWTKLKNIRK